jgi:hypothetical protein
MKTRLVLIVLAALLFPVLAPQQNCFVFQGKIVCCDRYGYCM